MPAFALAEQLVEQAAGIDGMDAQAPTLAAIRINRSVLDEPDPSASVLKAVGTALRAALSGVHGHYSATLAAEQSKLDAHPAWQALPAPKRTELLQSAGITALPSPATHSDDELLTP